MDDFIKFLLGITPPAKSGRLQVIEAAKPDGKETLHSTLKTVGNHKSAMKLFFYVPVCIKLLWGHLMTVIKPEPDLKWHLCLVRRGMIPTAAKIQ